MQGCEGVGANPSPDVRGCREAAGEGYKTKEMLVVPLTRPAGAVHPLPSGEGIAPKHFAIWMNPQTR